jgi:hypothetical protein
MATVWVVIGCGVIVASVLAFLLSRRQASRSQDMGAVSHHWIAEHRFGSGHDSRN